MLDLDFDDVQQALADAVASFCAGYGDALSRASEDFPREAWRALAELGVLGIGADDETGPVELVAAMEALGRAVFPGPLPATALAVNALSGDERAAVARGDAVASLARPPLVPWAAEADILFVLEAGELHRAEPAGAFEPIDTLGGEPWGRGALVRGGRVACGERALLWHDLALAAYLAAAGRRLVDEAAEYARTRQQFGQPIGSFQAVSHPLADRALDLDASRALARVAAWQLANEQPSAPTYVAGARLSAARNATAAAHTAHQTFGAVGMTLEGPVYFVTRRIRQLASSPPGDEHARERVRGGLANHG